YPYCSKYEGSSSGPVTDYSTILRLSEQFLIRAEARAKQGKLSGLNSAETDMNIIRNRAGLGDISFASEAEFMSALQRERLSELFCEWGHRWLDLKRWGRADAVLAPIKGPGWQPTDVLYPIPEYQRLNSPEVSQNPGYPN
ncbi:MAG TPA: RagB/SusD family nutrient uptake outer membrane protein, partial [Parasegetibacter sp.]